MAQEGDSLEKVASYLPLMQEVYSQSQRPLRSGFGVHPEYFVDA